MKPDPATELAVPKRTVAHQLLQGSCRQPQNRRHLFFRQRMIGLTDRISACTGSAGQQTPHVPRRKADAATDPIEGQNALATKTVNVRSS